MRTHYVVTMSNRPMPNGAFPPEEPGTGQQVHAIDIDAGKWNWTLPRMATAAGFLLVAGSAVGTFVANSAKKDDVAPVTIVARVNDNERAVISLQGDVKDLQVDTAEIKQAQRDVGAKLDLLIERQWQNANAHERRAMRRTSSRIAESAGTDPLGSIQE